jgi:hypothetical protein
MRSGSRGADGPPHTREVAGSIRCPCLTLRVPRPRRSAKPRRFPSRSRPPGRGRSSVLYRPEGIETVGKRGSPGQARRDGSRGAEAPSRAWRAAQTQPGRRRRGRSGHRHVQAATRLTTRAPHAREQLPSQTTSSSRKATTGPRPWPSGPRQPLKGSAPMFVRRPVRLRGPPQGRGPGCKAPGQPGARGGELPVPADHSGGGERQIGASPGSSSPSSAPPSERLPRPPLRYPRRQPRVVIPRRQWS